MKLTLGVACIITQWLVESKLEVSTYPGSRNCAARQQALQTILDLADESSKTSIII